MVIAFMPFSSAIFANSTATMLLSSQPFLIFSVTGTWEFLTTASIISPASSRFNNSLLPSPFFTTFGAGHPIFISIIGDVLLSSFAANDIASISFPNIWAATGICSFSVFNNSFVFSSL